MIIRNMSFVIPSDETKFEGRIKEVSTVTYTTNQDTDKIKNLVRMVMSPPLLLTDTIRFLDDYAMIVLKVHAIEDTCNVWITAEDEDQGCKNNTVLFVYFSPANPRAGQAEVDEAVRKIKAIARIP